MEILGRVPGRLETGHHHCLASMKITSFLGWGARLGKGENEAVVPRCKNLERRSAKANREGSRIESTAEDVEAVSRWSAQWLSINY